VTAIQGGDLIETRSVAGAPARIELRAFSPWVIQEPPPGAARPARAEGIPIFE